MLDPESLIGVSSAVLKVAIAGALLGVIWRREQSFGQVLSSFASGFGSAAYLAPALLAHLAVQNTDIRGGVIFTAGVLGNLIFMGIAKYAPVVLRRLAARLLGLEVPAAPGDPNGGGGA